MTSYEGVVRIYDYFHDAFGWTVAEIDATELGYLLTLMKVRVLSIPVPAEERLSGIDEVL